MQDTGYFKNKKITIIGLGRSGLACAELLNGLGAKVSVTDNQDNECLRLNAAELKSKKVKVELGRHSQEFIKGRDMVVISPGVPDESPAVIRAIDFGIPVMSEIELAWINCRGRVIAVTGSTGKSTVTTLIGKMLEAAARRVFVCGNIGRPFSGEIEKISKGDFVSLEVSSFQLEKINSFKPNIALILNFSSNHLDRYKNLEEYLGVKKRIFMNQDENDYLVLNRQDAVLKGLAPEAKAKVVFFSKEEGLNVNQSAVLAVGSILNIERRLILKVFEEFKGLEHRMEFVAEINGVRFINDSKATTADSTVWALENLNGPVILIAGGKDKGVDYSLILEPARGKIKQLILLGQARDKIEAALGGALGAEKTETLTDAVRKAFVKAVPGDCVLLSPMCSSFDMFSSYEERGRVFKDCVFELAKEQGSA